MQVNDLLMMELMPECSFFLLKRFGHFLPRHFGHYKISVICLSLYKSHYNSVFSLYFQTL